MQRTRGFTTLLELFVVAAVLMFGAYWYLHKQTLSSMATLPMVTSTNSVVSPSGTYEIRTKVFGLSTTTLPYITGYRNAQIMNAVNAQLQKIEDDFSCGTVQDLQSELEAEGHSQKEILAMIPTQMMDVAN